MSREQLSHVKNSLNADFSTSHLNADYTLFIGMEKK